MKLTQPKFQGPDFYTEDLNRLSVEMLLNMGYDRDLVVQALRHFRDEAKYKRREYKDEGEVARAMDWISDF